MAGSFYPAEPSALARTVDALLDAASPPAFDACPRALVVPHAGYVYSGPVAASAFAALRPFATSVRRIVLVGPCHRVPLRGFAVPAAEAFATPLGAVPIDMAAARNLGLPASEPAHRLEHSLEVEVPFLQRVLGTGFSLVPIVVGHARAADLADVLDALLAGDGTLLVVSTDLTHYLPWDDATAIDRDTARLVVALDAAAIERERDRACGATGLAAALLLAKRNGWTADLLDLRNSGDTSGDRRGGVVGYGAFAIHA